MAGPWRSPALAAAVARLEDEIRDAWARLRGELDVAPGSPEESELAWLVVDDPGAYDWRTVDGAVDRLTCPDCGARLTAGPATCETCEFRHRMRFGARERDRPHVPPGNEHALRVATAVTRSRHRYSPGRGSATSWSCRTCWPAPCPRLPRPRPPRHSSTR
ncbi:MULTISPECIES: hypothetical protein [Micromonospora]|uniref:hypothetical protein n=1 Tax=Micromonospora TaxID=1873 RepID=UPI000B0D29B5|nr:hypothetical protein [Micromonospora globosa]